MGTRSKDAEGEAWSARTKQVGVAQNPNYPHRKGGVGRVGQPDGNICIGIIGALGAKTNSLIAGGILEQLIQDAEDQLQASIECIEWYKRERDKNLKRLNKLKELRDLKQKSDESEQPE